MLFRKKPAAAPRRRPSATPANGRPSGVFSYYASRSAAPRGTPRDMAAANSTEPASRRLPRLAPRRIVALLAVIALVALAAANMWLDTEPKVVAVGGDADRTFLHPVPTYQEAAAALLAGSLTNRNKITVNTGKIGSELRRQFPELAATSVTVPVIGSEPVIHIQAFTPQIILSAANGTYVLDTEGRAFLSGNEVTKLQKLGLPVLRDQSGLVIRPESPALPKSDVAFITEVTRQLSAQNIPIAGMTLPGGKDELDVQVKDLPYTVKFNLRSDAREGAGAFIATKRHLEGEGKTPGQYVDVRVPGKVFYR